MNTEQLSITQQILDDWKLAMIRLVVIYRIKAKTERIPINVQQTNFEFIEHLLEDMYKKNLITQSKEQTHWTLTEKGESVFESLREIDDHLLQFDIFTYVHMSRDVSKFLDDDGDIMDGKNDPRFEVVENQTPQSIKDNQTEDMRIATILFLNQYAIEVGNKNTPKVNSYHIAFVRMINKGNISTSDIWTNLQHGTFFSEVQEIVDSVYDWKIVADNTHIQECKFKEGKVQISVIEGEDVVVGQEIFTDMEGNIVRSDVDGKVSKILIENDDSDNEFLVFEIEMSPESHIHICKEIMCRIYRAGMLQLQKEENFSEVESEGGLDCEDDENEVVADTAIYSEDDGFSDIWGCGVYTDPYEPYGNYSPYDPLDDAIVFSNCIGVLDYCW